MAKRKKPIRKPDISLGDRSQHVLQEIQRKNLNGLEGEFVADIEQNLSVEERYGSEVKQDAAIASQGEGSQLEEGLEDGTNMEMPKAAWADRCEEGVRGTEEDFQSDSQLHWQQFRSSNLSSSEPKLEYTEPIFRNGQKLAQVDAEEVRIQSANWSSAVVCMVLGANPPMAVFEATRDHVLENGVLQFDRKPVIVRPGTTDLSAIRLVRSVPLWNRLHDLGLQYWGSKCLSALVSTIGKPLLVDKFTKERSRVQFARVLVEMEITDNPPRSFQFINEYGQVVEQSIEYEWLPTKCKSCSGFGHSMAECRKDLKALWVEKVPPLSEEKQLERTDNPDGAKGGTLNKQEEESQATEEAKTDEGVTSTSKKSTSGQVIERNKEGQWLTPRRVSSQKTGSSTGVNKPAGLAQNKGNQFGILQEQERGVQELFRKNKVGIGGLLETKLCGKKIDEFMEHRFPNWDFFTSPRTEGRLLILWRKGLANMSILEDSPQLVHCQIRTGGCSLASSELVDSVEWKSIAKVEAIKSMGSYFTWTNNQDGLERIYSKIDHALIDEDWLDVFPQSVAVFQWEVVSDHCSCTVSNISLKSMGTKLFRYYNFWSNHPDFKQIVLKSWKAPMQSSGLKAIFTRLIHLKHHLKKLNRDGFGVVGLGYHVALEALQTAQFQAQEKPLDFQLQEAAKEKRRKADNSIASYTNDNGLLVDDFKEVVSHFTEHFKSHLGSPSSASGVVDQSYIDLGSKLSVEQQLYLLKPFSTKEIKAALFSIPNTKSPGPDGYGSGFFKTMWKDIGQDICSAITHGFSTGHFPKELHETTLSLIPKVSNPARASDYMPIACCSTLYKVMAKLLCSRLVVVLPYLVQSNQGVFVRGRSIAHNIMILQDLIKNYSRAITSPRCAIKIDISKAYDTVDWLFLVNLLKAFCFPSKFIGWVMNCIRSTAYSLLINGRVQCTFQGVKV
ncbi:uncharacterized protein LOC133825062 [Humulus lupulus]|uniref:uncharacterized protein LOC133825062 n=1 Tax=Humulus lupulus TaxID=3486 RepID=UPI002B40C2E6|nr:uncharacterized protein LOC133825062 [Humulus lupulus]